SQTNRRPNTPTQPKKDSSTPHPPMLGGGNLRNYLSESKINGKDDINKRLTVKLNLKGVFPREVKTTEIEGATKQFVRKAGQFIYGKQNLYKGAFGIIPLELNNYLSSGDIPSFDFNEQINPNWFYYYFSRKNFYESLERLSTGTGSKRISPKEFLNIKIKLPSLEEQEKIANFLSIVDDKIDLLKEKIMNMEEFKKGLLQKMFICDSNTDTPKLRFEEFLDQPFEEYKLGDITSNESYGMNVAATDFDGENKYIRITDIDENSNQFVPDPLSSPEGGLDDKFLLSKNDLLFARTGASTGKTYLYNENDGKLYFAGFLIRFNIKKANAKFVFYNTLRETYKKWVKIMSVRSGQPGINMEEYKKLKIKLPSLEEQEKIANFLSEIDNKISLIKEQLMNMELFKKGLLQKMFICDSNTDTPKLRFEEFLDQPFEEYKLGDITSNESYGMNVAATDFDGENKYIRITDIDENSNQFVPDPLSSPEGGLDDKFLLSKNDLLFARTGASTGKTYLYNENDGKLYFAGFLIRFNIKKANAKFVFYNTLRETYKKWVKIMSVRSGQPGINMEEYKKLKIKLPSLEEQEKIANFLSEIDNKISLIKEQLMNMELFKKCLLQKMFI
ncbi:MAG: restriction endonuclease subunit S, partial [Methanobacteriaceae archaeon]|nr:restriction endonuclease subunit S [Methanobacteriaceae archaeon]